MDADKQAEAKDLMEKLAKLFASDAISDGQMKTFDDLEIEANEMGDQFSALLVQQSIEQGLDAQPVAPKCPKCGQPGCCRDEPEPWIIDTARGQVQWNENEYFCRKCRKSFFPSDGILGL